MNAADQRRLTPWLAGLCVLLAGVWLALLLGLGRGIHWLPPGVAHELPSARQSGHVGAPPSLERDAEVWQRPLFTSNRQPAPVATDQGGQSVSLDNLELTGVILAPGMHVALLTDRDDGHTVRVHEGDNLAQGSWMLKTLEPRSAEFVDNGQVTRLQLKVAAATGVASTASANAGAPRTNDAPAPERTGQPSTDHHADDAQAQRIQALKTRIEQRRRQQAAHAGDH